MTETIKFRKIYTEDLAAGNGTVVVTLADGSIASLTKIGLTAFPLNGYGHSSLPGSSVALAGQLADVTDNIGGVWKYTGTQWIQVTGGIVNVKDRPFGAKGDGSTDDTAAITAAAAAASSSSVPLVFPAGTYNYSTGISGVSILGVGHRTKVILNFSGTGSAVTVSTGQRHENYWIKPGASATTALEVTNNNWLIDQVKVGYDTTTTNSANGAYFHGASGSGCYFGLIGDLYVAYMGGYGIKFETTGSPSDNLPRVYSIVGSNIVSVNNTGTGIHYKGTQNITFHQMTLESNGTGLTSEFGVGASGNITNVNNNMFNLYIANNTTDWSVTASTFSRHIIQQFNTGAASDPPATILSNAHFYGRGDAAYIGKAVTLYDVLTGVQSIMDNSGTTGLWIGKQSGTETIRVRADGRILWSNDTNIYRNAANELKTDDGLTIPGTTALPLTLTATKVMQGSGTPEGAITAPAGSVYLNTAGGASTTLYIKESGSGNTGWVAK